MENARICPSALDHSVHILHSKPATRRHTALILFSRSHHRSFFLSLSVLISFFLFHPLNFVQRRWETHEKRKETRMKLLYSRMHPSLYLYAFSLAFHFHFFFFSAGHRFPPSPPRIIITTLFSLRDNLRSSVEARRNVTGCFGGTRINLARRE